MKCRRRNSESEKPKDAPSIVIVGTPPPAPGWPGRASASKATHTDVALTSLFNAHISLLNSERTAIWQRYAISLAANALLVGFMGEKAPRLIVAIAILGVVLSICSMIMLQRGYTIFHKRLAQAGRFRWRLDQDINPIASPHQPELGHEEARKNLGGVITFDLIKWCALLMLFGFAILYAAVGLIAAIHPEWLRKAQCENATGQTVHSATRRLA